MNPPKSIFRSRTAALALITTAAGTLAFVNDEAQAAVTQGAPLILIVLGVLNLILRRVTRDRVVLFPKS